MFTQVKHKQKSVLLLTLLSSGILFGAATSESETGPDAVASDAYLRMVAENKGFSNAPLGADTELMFYNNTANPVDIIYANEEGGELVQYSATLNKEQGMSLGNALKLMSVIGARIRPATGLIERGGWGSWLVYGEAAEKFAPYEIPKVSPKEGYVPVAVFERSSYLGAANFHIRLTEMENRAKIVAARRAMSEQSGMRRLFDASKFSVKNKTPFTFVFQGSYVPWGGEGAEYQIPALGGTLELNTEDGGGQLATDFKLKRLSRFGIQYPAHTYRLNDLKQRVKLLGETKEIPFDENELVSPDEQRKYQITIEGVAQWQPIIERIQ